jgi:hypothetical protein
MAVMELHLMVNLSCRAEDSGYNNTHTFMDCFFFFDSMTVSCSTNLVTIADEPLAHARSGHGDQHTWSAQPAHRYLTMFGGMDGGREGEQDWTESEVSRLSPESTYGFKSRGCKIGCRNGRGNGPQVQWLGGW